MQKKLPNPLYLPHQGNIKTMSGAVKILGSTLQELTIGDITKKVLLFVVGSTQYDLILGLDLIPKFKISVNDSLCVSQLGNALTLVSQGNLQSMNFLHFEKLEEKLAHLDPENKSKLKNLVKTYDKSFAQHPFDVGNVKDYECSIELSSNKYVAKKPYRCTYADQTEIDRQVDELLKHGMISESRSPYASPVTMQYRKVGLSSTKQKTRMCCDYRELNKLVIPENQPFPLIDDIFLKSKGCSWYSALDINQAFWSIPITPKDRYKSAFITQRGLYEWRSMPFGLRSAPAIFQKILSGILRRRDLSKFCVNYLDDILVFSNSFEEHLHHLSLLFKAIYEEGFRLNFGKCTFAKQSINYLGHTISANYVKPLHDNLVAIRNLPVPTNRRKIRQFLGKLNFYRKFIPSSATLLEPFYNLLRKRVPFSWTPQCQGSFDRVKLFLTSEPILAIFDRTKPTFIYTDASGVGVAAVLKQGQDDGSEKPVAYFSRKLSEAQRKKRAIYIYIESLAIKEAVRYWKYWLLGHHFTVITDHRPLEQLNLKARTDEELGDLAHELLQFDFEVIYRPGSQNSEADCLSRNPVLPSLPDSDPEIPILQSFNFLSVNDICKLQEPLSPTPSDTVKSGVIFRKFKSKSYIVLDSASGERLAKTIHLHFGHVGANHCIAIIRKHFYFPKMYLTCRNVCRKCHVCIANKTRRIRRSGLLGLFGPATKPFQIMSLDTVGGFAGNNSPKKYFHLLIDHFTRFVYSSSSSGQSSRDFINLVKSVNSANHIETLLTDQYGGLSSDDFESFCASSGIKHIFVAVDSAFSNGLNERAGQTLVNRLRCARNDVPTARKHSWTSLASKCVAEYNSTPHSVTGFSPSYRLSAKSCDIIPNDLLPHDPCDLAADREMALQNTIRYHNYNKQRYDRHKIDCTFNVGDIVFIDNGNKLNRSKLDPVRLGPFAISKRLSDHIYEVDTGTNSRFSKKLYHISKMLPL